MSNINLIAAIKRIRLHGPDRVMVNKDLESVGYLRAFDRGVTPDIIFIRDDGWTLGAPEKLEQEAYSTWPTQWVGFIRKPETEARSMSEYPAEAV